MMSALASPNTEVETSDYDTFEGMEAGEFDVPKQRFVPEETNEFVQWRHENVKESLVGANYGMVWLDIEANPSSGCSWSGHSGDSNC